MYCHSIKKEQAEFLALNKYSMQKDKYTLLHFLIFIFKKNK